MEYHYNPPCLEKLREATGIEMSPAEVMAIERNEVLQRYREVTRELLDRLIAKIRLKDYSTEYLLARFRESAACQVAFDGQFGKMPDERLEFLKGCAVGFLLGERWERGPNTLPQDECLGEPTDVDDSKCDGLELTFEVKLIVKHKKEFARLYPEFSFEAQERLRRAFCGGEQEGKESRDDYDAKCTVLREYLDRRDQAYCEFVASLVSSIGPR